MQVKLFVKGVIWPSDVFERTVEIRSEEDYDRERQIFADQLSVDVSRVQDDIDPDGSHLMRRIDESCPGDCDQCKYAYYATDHGYAYEESKLHCKLKED